MAGGEAAGSGLGQASAIVTRIDRRIIKLELKCMAVAVIKWVGVCKMEGIQQEAAGVW
jgi:hypothetical protein